MTKATTLRAELSILTIISCFFRTSLTSVELDSLRRGANNDLTLRRIARGLSHLARPSAPWAETCTCRARLVLLCSTPHRGTSRLASAIHVREPCTRKDACSPSRGRQTDREVSRRGRYRFLRGSGGRGPVFSCGCRSAWRRRCLDPLRPRREANRDD